MSAGLAHALACDDARAASQPVLNPALLDGSSFGGLALTTDPQSGDAHLGALRAEVWTVGDTQRALLTGDVRLRVAGYTLHANRASVWIETRYEPDGTRLRQLAVYLDGARDPGAAAGSVLHADRLLVTVVVTGDVLLRIDSLARGRPSDAFLVEGDRRLARFLIDTIAIADAGEAPPILEPLDESARIPRATLRALLATSEEILAAIPAPDPRLPADPGGEVRTAREGVVTFHAPQISLRSEPDERAVILGGGVTIQQVEARTGRTVQLTATRAVVFLEPGDLLAASSPTEAVRGVYLEGDVVATDGSYTLRGAQVFYDVRTQRAVLVDAVFWTYDEQLAMPIYVRASTIRQESERQWTAREVRMSNAAFAEPTLSIGARSVTVTRAESSRAESATIAPSGVVIDAQSPVFLAGGVPTLPLPRYRGSLDNPPLRKLQFDSRAGSPVVRSTWDLQTLTNLEFGPGFRADLLLDAYFDRGPAFGLESSWQTPDSRGGLFGYYVYDNGEDRFGTGREIDRDSESRGVLTFEHVLRLNDDWTLFLEAAYMSDPAFIAAFFPGLGETSREFASSAYLRRVRDNELLSIEARASLQDYVPNEYLLQSPGSITEKLPEATYARVADELLGGAVSYTSETTASNMSLRFMEVRPEEIGFDTPSLAQRAFGIAPNASIADRLRAQGLDEESVARFDTRHELSLPIQSETARVTPFLVGRFTAYDDDFSEFDRNADSMRLYGGMGVRASTTFQRIDDNVESKLFDMHRLRHLVEPSVTLWHASSSVTQGALPVYDPRVEGINTGSAARVGVKQTWQTYRGGPGRWRSVDLIVLNTDYVYASGDADRTSPIGRWVDSRPEYSVMGEYFTADALWQATDALALLGFMVYDTEESDLATAALGAIFDVAPDLRAFGELRHIEPLDSTLVDVGAEWLLSAKHSFGALGVFDLDQGDVQSVGLEFERRFSQMRFTVALGYDDISGDTSIGISLQPLRARGANRDRAPIGRTILPSDRMGALPQPSGSGPFTPSR